MFIFKDVEKETYKKFIYDSQPISFLQNFEWGEIEERLGKKVYRFGIYLDEEMIGILQIIGNFAKRGNFLSIAHGPILKEKYKEYFEEIVKDLVVFIKKEKAFKNFVFLRANFLFEYNENLLRNLLKIGFKISPKLFVTDNFWVKSLEKDINSLLDETSSHHKKLILEGEEKPFLEIEKTQDLSKIDIFLELYKKLAKSKNFVPYPDELIKEEFKEFVSKNSAFLYLGKVENKYVSSAIIIFTNNFAFYHHGASEPIKEPINYKLHWKIILDAKERGCKLYNFWGITEKGPQHPWYGLTLFKKGFGGKLIKLLPTLDYPLNWKYYLTYLYESLKYKNRN